MEGPSHMRIGAAVDAAAGWSMGAPAHLAIALHPAHLPPIVEVVPASAGACLVCGAIGAIAGLAPDLDTESSTIGAALPGWWHALTPGHRGLSHSLPAVGLWWVAAWVACAVLGAAGSGLLPVLVVAGVASHLLADALTSHGIRPFYPLSNWHLRSPLAFTSGSRPEPFAVAAVVLLAVAWMVGTSRLLALIHGGLA